MPESTIRHISSPTASRISATVSTGAGSRSSCLPPWLESCSPSTPSACERRAASIESGPLTSSVPGQRSRIRSRSPQPTVGSNWALMLAIVGRGGAVDAGRRIRELDRRRADQADPVARLGGDAGERAKRETRWDRQAVAHVARAAPRDRRVDAHRQHAVPARPGSRHELVGDGAIAPHVELEPEVVVPARREILDRGGADGRQRVREAGLLRRAGDAPARRAGCIRRE